MNEMEFFAAILAALICENFGVKPERMVGRFIPGARLLLSAARRHDWR